MFEIFIALFGGVVCLCYLLGADRKGSIESKEEPSDERASKKHASQEQDTSDQVMAYLKGNTKNARYLRQIITVESVRIRLFTGALRSKKDISFEDAAQLVIDDYIRDRR